MNQIIYYPDFDRIDKHKLGNDGEINILLNS